MESTSLTQQILAALDILRSVGVEGRNYAKNEYDTQRYETLIQTVSRLYALLSREHEEPAKIQGLLERELGSVTPKIGIDVGVIHNDRMLVLRRSDDQTWCLPCGWMTVGETVVQTAIREVFEETRIRIAPIGYLRIVTKGPVDYPILIHHQLNVLVVSKSVDIPPAVKLSEEHSQYQWISSPDEVHWHSGHEKAAQALYTFMKSPSSIPMLSLDQ